jgi:hypothetical protein
MNQQQQKSRKAEKAEEEKNLSNSAHGGNWKFPYNKTVQFR